MLNNIINVKNKYFQFLSSMIFGMFGVLAFSPYNFWPASIVSLTGFFVTILDTTWKKAAYNALFWGFGFFSIGLQWIYVGITQFTNIHNYVAILLITILIIYLSIFIMIFSVLHVLFQSLINQWKLISITPILWSITERLRGNTFIGIPWLQFGYTQINGPIKGIGPVLGVEGITFILVFISSLLAFSIKKKHLLALCMSLMTLIILWPLQWIQWYQLEPKRTTHISLVQGNINSQLHWDLDSIQSTLKTYLKHTIPILNIPKIIIWPESAIPGHEILHNAFLTLFDNYLKQHQTCLITGIIDRQFVNNDYYHYNSIIVLGNTIPYQYPSSNRYNKHHLVLCSERLPGQFFFKPLFQYFGIPTFFMQKGQYLQPQLVVKNIKMTAAICYEIIFGNQIRDNFKSDSDFLITIANNVWFGNSIGPWQHFQMTRMRALELGRPILCGTNNGITAIIGADGSIQAQLPQFVSNVLSSDVTPTSGLTPYAKFGSLWLFISITIFLTYLLFLIKNKISLLTKN